MDFLSHSVVVASAAVVVVHQILKSKIVPAVFANRYPVPTNIILSVIATLVIVHPHFDTHNLVSVLVQIGTVAVIAALTYNQLLQPWMELHQTESAVVQ